MPETMAHPQWLDEQLFPFQSRCVEVEGNRIHSIDEGTGPILFFVHPGVGRSLIYRYFVDKRFPAQREYKCFFLSLDEPSCRVPLAKDSFRPFPSPQTTDRRTT